MIDLLFILGGASFITTFVRMDGAIDRRDAEYVRRLWAEKDVKHVVIKSDFPQDALIAGQKEQVEK
jgi:hypothetical protein